MVVPLWVGHVIGENKLVDSEHTTDEREEKERRDVLLEPDQRRDT